MTDDLQCCESCHAQFSPEKLKSYGGFDRLCQECCDEFDYAVEFVNPKEVDSEPIPAHIQAEISRMIELIVADIDSKIRMRVAFYIAAACCGIIAAILATRLAGFL